jgi:hypothetical protein
MKPHFFVHTKKKLVCIRTFAASAGRNDANRKPASGRLVLSGAGFVV